MSAAPFPPRAGDLPIAELLPQMDALARSGATTWLKWTCPACGERCIADDANGYHVGGYTHSEKADGTPCGAVYTGTRFGLLLMQPLPHTEDAP